MENVRNEQVHQLHKESDDVAIIIKRRTRWIGEIKMASPQT